MENQTGWFGNVSDNWMNTKTGNGRSPFDEDEEDDLEEGAYMGDLDFDFNGED